MNHVGGLIYHLHAIVLQSDFLPVIPNIFGKRSMRQALAVIAEKPVESMLPRIAFIGYEPQTPFAESPGGITAFS